MTKARDLANGGFGLVLVKPSTVVGGTDNGKGTVSFSGASSVSLNDVFNSTYTNYKIILNDITPPGPGAQIFFRMRVGGSDNSTAGNYMWAEIGLETDGGSSSNSGGAAATFFNIDFNDSANGISAAFDIYTPFVTSDVTRYTGISQSHRTDYTNSWFRSKGGNMSVTTSYTGFTIVCSSGNMSGSVSVYGYNK